MDPRDFRSLAAKLAAWTEPAAIRTAISRAYYAAYHVGAHFLEKLGFPVPKRGDAHIWVEHRLSNSGNLDVQRAGSQLSVLRTRRIEADYRLNRDTAENQKNAFLAVEEARKIISILDGCPTGPQRAQIVKAIEEYQKKTSSHS